MRDAATNHEAFQVVSQELVFRLAVRYLSMYCFLTSFPFCFGRS